MRDIVIIVLMGIIFSVVFYSPPKSYIPYNERVIYDRFATDTEAMEQDEDVFTLVDLSAAKQTKEEVKEPARIKKIEKVIRETKKTQKEETEKRIKEAVKEEKPKLEKETPLNFYSIRDLVRESEKSYYYSPDLKTEAGGISLRLISATPHRDNSILKIEIENKSKSYFFVGGVSITAQKANVLDETFGEQFLKPDSLLILYCIIRAKENKGLALEIIESGDSKRSLKLSFDLP